MRFRCRAWLMMLVAALCASAVQPNQMQAAELIQLNQKNFESHCPRGKEVDAIYGDWVLRNDHIVAVIAAPKATRNANMTVRNVGAMLIDYAPRNAQSDQLSCFYPAGARYDFHDEAAATVDLDGRPVALTAQPRFEARKLSVTFIGKPVKGEGSTARVTYTLGDNDAALTYHVELVNESGAAQELPAQDLLRCDGTTFAFGQDDATRLFWAEERAFHQAYGILPDQGTLTQGKDRRALILTGVESDAGDNAPSAATLDAGKTRAWGGKLLCNQGLPGVRSLVEGIASEKPTQSYQLKLNAADGAVEHAEVEIFVGDRSLGLVHSDHEGWVRLRLLPGEYAVKIRATGRSNREHSVKLSGAPVSESLTLDSATRVKAQVTDEAGKPIPAKLQFIGLGGAETPKFGPDAGEFGVRNLLYTANGNASQPIAPGSYRVIISHGPEYDAVTESIALEPGKVAQIKAKLVRTVDTRGWISGEFHSHSSPSGDNTASQLGRVLNLLAEHLEFAPCTEHNRVDTYAEHLAQLKATALMATCTGMELTGALLPVNHQNAFPLHHHPHEQDGGGPTTSPDPVAQIERLAMWDDKSDKVVQMNHPNIPQVLGDRDTDGTPDEGFRKMFDFVDVIEVDPLPGIFTPPSPNLPPREQGKNPVFHWMQLLNLGYHMPGVVNTDAHYNWHGSGWLRNYIASSQDDPAKVTTEEMIASIQAGNMVMTTAPFMEVELRAPVGGQPRKFISGERVALGDAAAKLWIRVQCANWYDINRVQVFANGRPLSDLNFTRGTHPQMFGTGAVRYEAEVDLPKLTEDTHIIVATIGEGLKLGEVMGSDRGELPPIAVSNPIYVDVDGGKFKPNGDNLGVPFMLPRGVGASQSQTLTDE